MRRRTIIPRVLLALLCVAVVSLVVILAIPFLFNANQFRPAIESELTKSLGRPVKIGDLKMSVWHGTVTASDLVIADDPGFSPTPFLQTKSLTMSISVWQALFAHKLNVSAMTIDAPETFLIQVPTGEWNFSGMGAKAAKPGQPAGGTMALSIKSLKINGARISMTPSHGKQEVLDNVSIELKDFAPGSVFPFSMTAKISGGGDVALDGKAGPINPTDVANTPVTATLKITNLNLAASGAVPAASGIDGIVSLDGMADSNGDTLQVTGKLKADNLKLAPNGDPARVPVSVDVSLAEDLKQHSGQISRADIMVGAAKASLTGTWVEEDDAPRLMLMLSAPNVPISGLTDLLPALDIVLPAGSTPEGGTATADLTVSGPPSALTVTGPVSLQNTRLKGFDLGSKLSPIEKLAGIKSGPTTEVQTLSANLQMSPNGTSLEDIRVVLPALGDVTGAGTISPLHELNFRMQATLHGGAVVSALAPANIPFSIHGTSSNPLFQPDTAALATEEISRGLNGVKVGGVGVGKVAGGVLNGLLGGKK